MKRGIYKRSASTTLLLVGEGYAEVAFLEHLKSIYVQRGSGITVSIKNAHGKGAENVIDVARRQRQNKGFDSVAALFDTDVGWNEETQGIANEHEIVPLLCSPCLENLLLGMLSLPTEGLNTDQLKARFKQRFGCNASALPMVDHFDRELIEKRAPVFPTLANLVHLLQTGKPI